MVTELLEIPPQPAKPRRTLLDIGADGMALEQLLEETGGDWTDDETMAIIDEWLNENRDALEHKLDGYCALIKEREAMAEARKQEAARMTALATTDLNLVKALKTRLQYFFDSTGQSKVETDRFKVAVQNNGGAVPLLVDEVDPSTVPEHFQKITVSIDTDAARDFLANGGTLDWARLGERGRHIRIR